jgi:hypothetical protein
MLSQRFPEEVYWTGWTIVPYGDPTPGRTYFVRFREGLGGWLRERRAVYLGKGDWDRVDGMAIIAWKLDESVPEPTRAPTLD